MREPPIQVMAQISLFRLNGMHLASELLEPFDLSHETSRPGWRAKRRRLLALGRAIIACAALGYLRREKTSLEHAKGCALETSLEAYCEVEFKRDGCQGSLKRTLGQIPLARATVHRHLRQVRKLYEQGELDDCDWAHDEVVRLLAAQKYDEAGLTWSEWENAENKGRPEFEEARRLLKERLGACLDVLPSAACIRWLVRRWLEQRKSLRLV